MLTLGSAIGQTYDVLRQFLTADERRALRSTPEIGNTIRSSQGGQRESVCNNKSKGGAKCAEVKFATKGSPCHMFCRSHLKMEASRLIYSLLRLKYFPDDIGPDDPDYGEYPIYGMVYVDAGDPTRKAEFEYYFSVDHLLYYSHDPIDTVTEPMEYKVSVERAVEIAFNTKDVAVEYYGEDMRRLIITVADGYIMSDEMKAEYNRLIKRYNPVSDLQAGYASGKQVFNFTFPSKRGPKRAFVFMLLQPDREEKVERSASYMEYMAKRSSEHSAYKRNPDEVLQYARDATEFNPNPPGYVQHLGDDEEEDLDGLN